MNLFSEKIEQNLPPTGGETGALEMLRCARCGRDLVADVVLAGDAACPYCGNLFRQPAYRRIEAITDSGSFIEIERETEAGDPLSFPGYRTKLEKERVKSKMQEGVVIGKATIKAKSCGSCLIQHRLKRRSQVLRHVWRRTHEDGIFISRPGLANARHGFGLISILQPLPRSL